MKLVMQSTRLFVLLMLVVLVVSCGPGKSGPDSGIPSGEESSEMESGVEPPTLASVDFGEIRTEKASDGRVVYVLPEIAHLRATIRGADAVQWRVYRPVGDDQEPMLILTPGKTDSDTWVAEWKEIPPDLLYLNLLAKPQPGATKHPDLLYVEDKGSLWVFLAGALVRQGK